MVNPIKKDLKSKKKMNPDELQNWDAILTNALAVSDLSYFEGERVTTYLYVAQADAAAISEEVTGQFDGTLDPVSNQVLTLLIPRYVAPRHLSEDPYSQALAEVVMEKIRERVKLEDEDEAQFKVPEEDQNTYRVGLEVAGWLPWHINRPESFWPAAPPAIDSPRWDREVDQLKLIQDSMNDQEREAIYKWNGQRGPWTGNWIAITNHYLFSHNIPFGKMIQVREALLTGLYDGAIVFFSAKYHYMVKRPKAYDESVHYEVTVPAHPSYPSGHSTEAGIAKTILSYYFPKETDHWDQLAEESCMSRLWGGIHYPIDDSAGRKSGAKIGDKVVKKVGNS